MDNFNNNINNLGEETTTQRFYLNVRNVKYSILDLFNMFSYDSTNNDFEHWRYSSHSGYPNSELVIFINRDRLSTVDATGLKAYLSNNNLIALSLLPAKDDAPTTTFINVFLLYTYLNTYPTNNEVV